MGDLIDRQAAIELIHSLYPSAPIMRMNRKRWKKKYKPYIEAEKALEMFPSAQLERKNGRWIDDKCSACGYKCSACGYRVEPWDNTPYCPNCGADMKGK